MKKLFTLLLVALVGLLPAVAQTMVTATFDFATVTGDPSQGVTVDNATITGTSLSITNNQLNIEQNGELTVKADEGCYITKIEFSANGSTWRLNDYLKSSTPCQSFTYSAPKKTFTALDQTTSEVKFAAQGGWVAFNQMVVTMQKAATEQPTPGGDEEATTTASFNFMDLTTLTPNPRENLSFTGDGRYNPFRANANDFAVNSDGVTITPTSGMGSIYYNVTNKCLQANSGSQIEIAAETGKVIKSITLTARDGNTAASFEITTGAGTIALTSDQYISVYTAPEDGESTVTLKATANVYVQKIEVKLATTGGGEEQTITGSFDFKTLPTTLNPAPNLPTNNNTIGTVIAGTTFTNNGISLVCEANSASDPKMWYFGSTYETRAYDLRLSAGNKVTITAPAGGTISSIRFIGGNKVGNFIYLKTGQQPVLANGFEGTDTWGENELGELTYTFTNSYNSVVFDIQGSPRLTLIDVTVVAGSSVPETHTPTAISYVLAGAEAVAMDNFVAKNVEIKAGATLSFIDPDGYAYGAAEADATLANNTATELTEYAPATAADVKAFKVAEAGVYNITTSFKNGKGTVTIVKVADPLTDSNGNSVATFNWSQPGTLTPDAPTGGFYEKTFTANGVNAEFIPGMSPYSARFVSSNGTTVLRLPTRFTLKFTAPAGKVIYNVKISGTSVNSSNTILSVPATTNSSNGVYTILPTYETNEVAIEIPTTVENVEYTYTTVTYADAYAPTSLSANIGNTTCNLTADAATKTFTASDVAIGEWGKNGTIKFSEGGSYYGLAYGCGAATEGEVAEAGKAVAMVGNTNLDESDWHAFSVAPGIYTVTVSFATGTPVMTLTKTGDIKQPKPTTMFAIIKGLAEPVELTLMGNSFLSKDNVTIGTTMGGESNFYFAESEDIVDGRTYGAAEANTPYNFDEWYNDLTEYAVDANPNRYTIPSGIYSIDVNIENDVFKVRMSKQGDLMPAALSIYNGEELTAMTADTEAKTFTITDYNIGAWGKPGTIKFTTAFMDMMFGDAYACGADTEGATAEAGKEYTMTGKDKMPIAEWYAYTVAEGVYTVTVSFATGKPVMTLTKTADFDQPKPTTMYAVIEGAEQPVAFLNSMGSQFVVSDVKIGTTMGQTMTIYFAENSDITTGRTYGAATANEAYDFENWNVDLTEFAAGAEANKFTVPAGIYSIDINLENDTPVFHMSKTGELMPAAFYIYNGDKLTPMEADAAAQQFTIADYEIGAWETAGAIKFTTAFIPEAFGEVYAAGADTEGATAEAGKEYTLNGKQKMPVSDWYSFTVAEGIYTVTVSFATGKPVMTLAKTADIEQPKPTTMYAVIGDAEPTLLFAATATDFTANDVTVNEATTLYFAENSVVAEGRTYGAATADETLEVPTWTTPLIEYAAGVEPNKFTLSAGIYSISLNFSDETPTLSVQKTGDVSGIEEIDAADDDAEYYTLQGVRVVNPTTGIYIRVQGNKATKVAIR